jgi:hypothetical protein
MRILYTDFDSLVLDKNFNDVLVEKNIRLRTSAPYKYQQNLAESYDGSIKNGIRTVMAYNNAPIRYWCYAMDYFGYTFNNLPRINETRPRNEISSESNPISVILYRSTLPGTTMYVPRSGSLYPSMALAAMTPQTETIHNQLVTTLTMISYSVKPSTVRYHFNLQYCATHGFSKKLPRVYNETRTKLPLMNNFRIDNGGAIC